MKPTVYIETTIVSYLTALPTRDLILAAHRELTLEWWNGSHCFDLFVSEAVIQEASAGDREAAERRTAAIQRCGVLEVNNTVADIARALLEAAALPPKAFVDAIHIATAAFHGMDYLLTWNCKHIANAATREIIEETCRSCGFEPPTICTPEELMTDDDDARSNH